MYLRAPIHTRTHARHVCTLVLATFWNSGSKILHAKPHGMPVVRGQSCGILLPPVQNALNVCGVLAEWIVCFAIHYTPMVGVHYLENNYEHGPSTDRNKLTSLSFTTMTMTTCGQNTILWDNIQPMIWYHVLYTCMYMHVAHTWVWNLYMLHITS